MKTYGWTPDFVRLKITSAQGWTYYAAAREMEMSIMGAVWQPSGDQYVAQERKKILACQKSNCRNSDTLKNGK